MCLIKYSLFFVSVIILDSYALNCHSEDGLTVGKLRNVYEGCLKKQGAENSSTVQGSDDERHEGSWKRENGMSHTERRNDHYMMDQTNAREKQTHQNSGRNNDRDYDMGDDESRGANNRDKMKNDGTRGRNGIGNRDQYGGNQFDPKDDYQSDEFGSHMTSRYNYPSNQPSRRFKREKRPSLSGQRSQFNPYSQRENTHASPGRNDSDNSSKEIDQACALHCFLESLEMTGNDDMPDRYLVTHAFTKDVKNEDLRDFLQESIEECFQILDNENAEDKCEFSKNLLMCLSEKGRANCDDWKDDIYVL